MMSVNIKVTRQLFKRLDEVARKKNITRNEITRMALREYLNGL